MCHNASMRKIDDKFLRVAAQEALRGEFRYKHGVVIAKNKEIISKGFNRNIGIDTVLSRYGLYYSMHAELDAIRRLPYEFEDSCTLYSVRAGGGLAKPCSRCLSVIARTSINRVVFSAGDGLFAEIFL